LTLTTDSSNSDSSSENLSTVEVEVDKYKHRFSDLKLPFYAGEIGIKLAWYYYYLGICNNNELHKIYDLEASNDIKQWFNNATKNLEEAFVMLNIYFSNGVYESLVKDAILGIRIDYPNVIPYLELGEKIETMCSLKRARYTSPEYYDDPANQDNYYHYFYDEMEKDLLETVSEILIHEEAVKWCAVVKTLKEELDKERLDWTEFMKPFWVLIRDSASDSTEIA
jgi:hypothetical protein